jgi:ribosomal protein S18 acetylase RimI-like enzyme
VIRRARVADAPKIARVHVDGSRAAYRGLVPQVHLDRLSYAEREASWRDILVNEAMITVVADEPSSGVVGFANGGARLSHDLPGDGELYAIYLSPAHWRCGIGRRLVQALVGELIALGCTSMSLWVLRDNPACAFYEALGGRRAGTAETFIGGACLPKVAFVWPTLPLA